MIVSLQSLTLQVETLGRLDAKEIPSRLYSISVASSDNFSESLHAYRQAGSIDTARQAVRLYHTQLLRLHQKLNNFYLDRNIEDRSALSALEELLERIEFLFKMISIPVQPFRVIIGTRSGHMSIIISTAYLKN